MSEVSVKSAVMQSMDRIAMFRKECAQVVVSGAGSLLWGIVDGSGDIDFENDLKGTQVAAVDTAMVDFNPGAVVQGFARNLNTYARHQGYSTFGAYLTAMRVRVSEDAADLWYSAIGGRLGRQAIFPKQARTLATYSRSGAGNTFSPTVGVPSVTVGPTPLEFYVAAVLSPGAVFTMAAPTQTNSAVKALSITLTSVGVGSVVVVGVQAVVTNTAVGDQVVGINTTAQFTVGDYVLVKASGKTELALVVSINPNVALALTSPLVESFASASAFVYPLFFKLNSLIPASGISSGDAVTVRPYVDRTPAW